MGEKKQEGGVRSGKFERNHQALGNRLIDPGDEVGRATGELAGLSDRRADFSESHNIFNRSRS